jgi:hypothetical protein
VTTWSRGRDSKNELEVDVNRYGSAFMFLACGFLGAVLSVVFLLIIPTDGGPHGYREMIADELPVLVFAVGMGVGVGLLIALLWSVLQRFFAAFPPRV